jgi:hypothetical protein
MYDTESTRQLSTSDKLHESNYGIWKLKMQMVLQMKDLWEMVDEEENLSDSAWSKKSDKARAIIGLSVSDSQLSHIRDCKTAKQVWTALAKVHEGSNLMRRLQLRREFVMLKKVSGESVQQYINRVNEARNKLTSIDDKIEDVDCVLALLSGLPDEYAPLVMALEAKGEDLKMESVVPLLLTEEQRKSNNDSSANQERAFFASKERKGKRNFKSSNVKKGTCHNCGKQGHWARDCRLPRKLESSAAAATATSTYAFTGVADVHSNEMAHKWILDTGASKHMTGRKEWLSEPVTVEQPIRFGMSTAVAKKKGNVTVSNDLGTAKLSNVLWCPGLSFNLFSLSVASSFGIVASFHGDDCSLMLHDKVIAKARKRNGLYFLDWETSPPETAAISRVQPGQSLSDWHKRLGHLNPESIKKLVKEKMVEGLNISDHDMSQCSSCVSGKLTRKAFHNRDTSSITLLEKISSDVCGPMQTQAYDGSRYFLTIVDHYSRLLCVIPIRQKDEAAAEILKWILWAERQTGAKVKQILTDNGGEYVNTFLRNSLSSQGIQHITTAPHNSEQNGMAERSNRTVMDGARTVLDESGLPKRFWNFAVTFVAYSRNRSPSSMTGNKTPIELFLKQKPSVSHMHPFGCRLQALIPSVNRSKLSSKTEKGKLLGYLSDHKGYIVWSEMSKKILKVRDIKVSQIENDRNSAEDEKSITSIIRELEETELEEASEIKDDKIERARKLLQDFKERMIEYRLQAEKLNSTHHLPNPTVIPNPKVLPNPTVIPNPKVMPNPTEMSNPTDMPNPTHRIANTVSFDDETSSRLGISPNTNLVPRSSSNGRLGISPNTTGATNESSNSRLGVRSSTARDAGSRSGITSNTASSSGKAKPSFSIEVPRLQRPNTRDGMRSSTGSQSLVRSEEGMDQEGVSSSLIHSSDRRLHRSGKAYGGSSTSSACLVPKVNLRDPSPILETAVLCWSDGSYLLQKDPFGDQWGVTSHYQGDCDMIAGGSFEQPVLSDEISELPLSSETNVVANDLSACLLTSSSSDFVPNNSSTWTNFDLPRYGSFELERVQSYLNMDFALAITDEFQEEPLSFKEAMNRADSAEWMKATQLEMDAIKRNKTWLVVDREKEMNVIGSRWVYKLKRDANGQIDRYKARLVAKGYGQKQGVDFSEVFAPVVRYCSLRILLSIAVSIGIKIRQYDVTSAFLNGELAEDVFMDLPEGFEQKGKVVKLLKTLYGLKQAPRGWHQRLKKTLLRHGFTNSRYDPGIYYRVVNGETELLGVYVDDMFWLSRRDKGELLRELRKEFELTDSGFLHWSLGMEFIWNSDGSVSLSQKRYIETILEEFNMKDCKGAPTPIGSGVKSAANEGVVDEEIAHKFRRCLGSVMYVMTCTRPDLCYAISKLSRYMSKPNEEHWIAMKRVLRYLQQTSHITLLLDSNPDLTVTGFCDADWGADVDDRRSITGACFFIGGALISWMSRRQVTVAMSSTESEYLALGDAVKEAIWLKGIVSELTGRNQNAVRIYGDNQGCLKLAENDAYHSRTKHIDIRAHFLRDVIERREVELEYVRTEDMTADILTKGLGEGLHWKHLRGLGLVGVKTDGKNAKREDKTVRNE